MIWEGRVLGTVVRQICFRDNQFDKKRPCLGSIGAEQARPLAWSHFRRLLHRRRVMSARSGKWNVRLASPLMPENLAVVCANREREQILMVRKHGWALLP